MIQIYLLSLLLVLLPPFILFGNAIYGTHSIAKLIWLGLFVLEYLQNGKKLTKFFILNKGIIFSFIFFLSQLISIYFARDKVAFFYDFEDFFFGYVFFLLTLIQLKKIKFDHILKIFTVSFVFDILYSSLLIFFSTFFFKINKQIINSAYLQLIREDYFRNRIGIESFTFVIIPILLFFILRSKKYEILRYLMFLINTFFILIGNYRTKSIIFLIICIGIFSSSKKKLIYYSVFMVFIFLLSFSNVTIKKYQLSYIDRYMISKPNKFTFNSRLAVWRESMHIFKKNPLGVGLGNYKDYIVPKLHEKQITLSSIAIYKNPHNIIIKTMVETGIFGILCYLIMMGQFLLGDFRLILGKAKEKGVYIACFWGLAVFALFNPSQTIAYQMLFWFLRAKILL